MNILRHCHSLPTSAIFVEQLIIRIAENVAVTCLAPELESPPKSTIKKQDYISVNALIWLRYTSVRRFFKRGSDFRTF